MDGETIRIPSVPASGILAASGQVYSIPLPLESHEGDERAPHGAHWVWVLLGASSPSDPILQEKKFLLVPRSNLGAVGVVGLLAPAAPWQSPPGTA